jgi:DNA-binding XRE family transcriptional regulator
MDSRLDDRDATAGRFKTLRQRTHLSQAHLATITGICR